MAASSPVGSSFCRVAISSRTRAMTSIELALGSTQTPMKVDALPDIRTS